MSISVVDNRFLLSDQQRDALLDWICQRPSNGRPLRAFLSSVAFAALRPLEALALRVRDARLPDEGPGDLVIRPRRLRDRGEAVEGDDAPRVVPACPKLAEVLREEVARRGLHPDDGLFTCDDGRPLSGAVYRRAWDQAREAVLEAHEIDSPLGRHVSDLRDACISKWLGQYCTGFEVFVVAERVGVSASSLVRRFPHCWLAQAQTDARRGEFVDPRDGAVSLKDYIETHWWPTQSGDRSTLERIEQRVRRHIVPHSGALPLNNVGTEALRGWKKRLEKDLGPTSIRLVWATLSGVLQAAVEDRRLARNPCRASTVRPPAAAPGRVEAWPPERVLAVRAALSERYRVLVEIGAGLGLRQGEAFGLSLEDIDFDEEIVHVRRQVKMVRTKLCFALPKGRKVRDVPLPSSVAKAIRQHMEFFEPVPVTMPWDDPRPAETSVEAKHRRPRTYSLLVTGRE